MKILFVCRGNVGRSQMAEAFFNKFVEGKHASQSAGTKLSGPEQPLKELSPATDNLIQCMREEGLDISENTREQLTQKMLDEADKIVFISDENDPVPDSLLANEKVIRWNLTDPKGTDIEFHRKIRDMVKEKVKRLIKDIS